MSPETVLRASAKYRGALSKLLSDEYPSLADPGGTMVPPGEFPKSRKVFGFERHAALRHVLGMFDKVDGFVSAGRTGKAFRWLGFAQGAMWALGVYSIDDMRADNTDPEPPSGP